MARPKATANKTQTRERILSAARETFAQDGVGAPLDKIAQLAGIRRPSLLHHFSSKQALVEAVIDDVLAKARARIVVAVGAGGGDYADTMSGVVRELRALEAEESGIGGVLLHVLLAEGQDQPVTHRVAAFIDVIYSSAVIAGLGQGHDEAELRAAIAHLVMGELTRLALGARADAIWGAGDGVDPLYNAYFLQRSPR